MSYNLVVFFSGQWFLFMAFGVRVLAKPMKYCSLARLTLSRSLCICSSGSKEEKSFGFCVFVYILCVFVYILCVFIYVFLGSQSQGSYISRDFVVDL